MKGMYDRELKACIRLLAEMKIPFDIRRTIVGRLKTMNTMEREKLIYKTIKKYGGTK